MGIIMRNNIAYSGGGGSETVELSMAEYEAREATGAIDSDTWYLIYDANDSYNAKKIVYDNAESGMEASTVQGAIDELNSNLDVRYNAETDMIQCLFNGSWHDILRARIQGLFLKITDFRGYAYRGTEDTTQYANKNVTPTISEVADSAFKISMPSTKDYESYGSVFSNTKFDLTNCKQIIIKCTKENAGAYWLVLTTEVKANYTNAFKKSSVSITASGTYTFDISSISGEYFIGIGVNRGGSANGDGMLTITSFEVV